MLLGMSRNSKTVAKNEQLVLIVPITEIKADTPLANFVTEAT